MKLDFHQVEFGNAIILCLISIGFCLYYAIKRNNVSAILLIIITICIMFIYWYFWPKTWELIWYVIRIPLIIYLMLIIVILYTMFGNSKPIIHYILIVFYMITTIYISIFSNVYIAPEIIDVQLIHTHNDRDTTLAKEDMWDNKTLHDLYSFSNTQKNRYILVNGDEIKEEFWSTTPLTDHDALEYIYNDINGRVHKCLKIFVKDEPV